jgi:hypothetical protein
LDIPSRQNRGLIDNPAPSAVRPAAGYLNGCPAAGQERGGERNVTVHDRRALSGRAQSWPAGQELRIDGADLLMANREPPRWERQYRIGLIERDYCFHVTRVGPLEKQIAQILRPSRRLGHSPSCHAPTVAPQCDIPPVGRSGRGLMVRAGPGSVTESARNAEAPRLHDLRPDHWTRASGSGYRRSSRRCRRTETSGRIIHPRTEEFSGPARLYRRQPAAAVIVREPASATSPRSPRHDDRTKRSRPMGRLVLHMSMNSPIRLYRVRGAR